VRIRNALTIHPRVAASSLGGSLSLILLWGISFLIDVPPEVAAAFTLVICAVCGWGVPAAPSAAPVASAGPVNAPEHG
jgi:hypothetical protein